MSAESTSPALIPSAVSRRRVLKALAGLGVGSVAFQRALAADVAKGGKVTPEMIRDAEWIAGLELSADDRATTAQTIQREVASLRVIREAKVENSVPPAVQFQPAP